jgi:hypothetical protein
MNRLYEIFKTPSGPSIGKALLKHTIFSPSQTGETVPLKRQNKITSAFIVATYLVKAICYKDIVIRFLIYEVTVMLQLIVTAILNVTKTLILVTAKSR